ncbi:MAG: DNA repair protein RadA [Actinomycetota bacterium]
MKAERAEHRCGACGYRSPRWFGRCPECDAWSSAQDVPRTKHPATQLSVVTALGGAAQTPARLATGDGEVDRVLGGGLVRGSVVLLAGEPGIGKSTLVLQMLHGLTSADARCLLVTGEESLDQVALRADRLGVPVGSLRAAASTSLDEIVAAAAAETADVLVVDSIQTVEDASLEQGAGSITQVRDCAAALVRFAKRTGTIVVIVGHVTKEGSVAGPKTLEHMVDVVLALEGERSGTMRLLRSSKNRFGSCDETGVFTMSESGLEDVEDPSALLLADRNVGVAGSIVFPSLEGTRPVLVEVQALLIDANNNPHPRRVAIGFDPKRLALMLGVLSKLDARVMTHDVFVAAAGGIAVREPAADLPLCLAIMSALSNHVIDPGTIAVGEVGLGGEVRRVPGIARRLAEAERLGFSSAVVPHAAEVGGRTIDARPVRAVHAAVGAALGTTAGARRRPSG